jgi:hypothetical protein
MMEPTNKLFRNAIGSIGRKLKMSQRRPRSPRELLLPPFYMRSLSMFRQIARPLVAGIAVVLWLTLAGTPAFAAYGHGVVHLGHNDTAYYGAANPHYWHGSYSYPSYRYTPYYGYGVYRYGGYGGAYVYRPYAYRSRGYRPWVGGGCR